MDAGAELKLKCELEWPKVNVVFLYSVPQVREGVSSYMSNKKRRRRVRDYQPLSTTEKNDLAKIVPTIHSQLSLNILVASFPRFFCLFVCLFVCLFFYSSVCAYKWRGTWETG